MSRIPDAVLEEIKQRNPLMEIVEAAGIALRSDGNGRLLGLCPFHPEKTPSFTVFVQKQPQDFHCFGCGAHGDVIAFVMKVRGLDFLEALRFLAEKAGIPLSADAEPVVPPDPAAFAADRGLRVETLTHFGVHGDVFWGRPVLRYPAISGNDRIKFTDNKKPKYMWAKKGGQRFWYGLDDALIALDMLVKLGGDRLRLYIVNGEPSVWACYEAEVPAICLAGGERALPTFERATELGTRLRALGQPVELTVVFDADQVGRTGAPTFATTLKKMIAALDTNLKATVSDVAALDISAVLPDVPKADVDDLHRRVGNELAAALAELPLLAEEKKETTEPPTLATLLDSIVAQLTRYVVFRSPAQPAAIALWVAHTHVLDAFDVTPYLHVRSAERRSGKSRVLEVIQPLVARPQFSVQLTEAATFRLIEAEQPTLLIDEVDAIFKGPPSDRTEGLRALLNAGYRRGATVPRCVGMGLKLTVHHFSVFCAKAMSGIGTSLPDTVADRSIPIVLARRKKTEPVAKFRPRNYGPKAKQVREQLEAWAQQAIDGLTNSQPEVPDLGNDRAEEVCESLLAIADVAGGEWPKRARDAARELSGGEPDTDSVGVQLLKAIYDVFTPKSPDPETPTPDPIDQMPTIDLLAALIEREGELWGQSWGRDVRQAIRDGENSQGPATKLASMLKPLGIQPKSIRLPDPPGGTRKGYERANFADAGERYCGIPLVDAGTPPQPTSTNGLQAETMPEPRGNVPASRDAEILGREELCRRSGAEPGGGHSDRIGMAPEPSPTPTPASSSPPFGTAPARQAGDPSGGEYEEGEV
jgi:hypothetical protein